MRGFAKNNKVMMKAGGGGGYGLAMIGAAVYWLQQANDFWHIVWALLKALVWPAFVVYDLLKHLG